MSVTKFIWLYLALVNLRISSAYRIDVTGEAQVIAALRKLELRAGDLSSPFAQAANDAAADARALAPKLSGRLVSTIRPARFKTAAVVTASAPYAGVQEYGWPARGIAAQPFLRPATDTKADSTAEALTRELERFIRAVGLS